MHSLDYVLHHTDYRLKLDDGINLIEYQLKKENVFIVILWKMNSTFYWNVLCIKIYVGYILNVIFGRGQMYLNLSNFYSLITKIL